MTHHDDVDIPSPPDDAPAAVNGAFPNGARRGLGLTHKQTRASRYSTPSRGVRIDTAAPDQQLARITSAQLACGRHAVITDLDAALLWGLPVPPRIALDPDRPVSVSLPVDGAHAERRHVRGRRLLLPPGHLVIHRGVRLTSPPRTWLDCAEFMSTPHLAALGDAALGRGLATEPAAGGGMARDRVHRR